MTFSQHYRPANFEKNKKNLNSLYFFSFYKLSQTKYPNSSVDNSLAKIKNYKSLKNNNNISRKESFFQYLFVQYILTTKKEFFLESNNKLDDSLKNELRFSEASKLQTTFQNQKISIILDNLNLSGNKLSKNTNNSFFNQFLSKKEIKEGSTSSGPQNEKFWKNKKNFNFWHPLLPSQNFILINYKKPFLCYWLLPFLGLISVLPAFIKNSEPNNLLSIPPVLLDKGVKYSLPFSLFKKANLIDRSMPNKMETNHTHVYPKANEINKEYSLFLSSSGALREFNGRTSIKNPYIFSINNEFPESKNKLVKYIEVLDSLFLSTLHDHKDTYQFSRKHLNSSFSNFSLAILNKNIKLNSNFNWYWHNLLLEGNKNSNISTALKYNGGINYPFFPNKLFLKGFSLNSEIANKKHFSLLKPRKDILLIQESTTQNILQKLLNKKGSRNETFKSNIKNIKSNIFINTLSSATSIQKILFLNKENMDIPMEQKSTYFIGILKDGREEDFKINNNLTGLIYTTPGRKEFISSGDASAESVNTGAKLLNSYKTTPYKSIKKALLLMDQALFEKSILNSSKIKQFFPTLKTFDLFSDPQRPINNIFSFKNSLKDYDFDLSKGQAEGKEQPLEKTLNLIFKNKNYNILFQKTSKNNLIEYNKKNDVNIFLKKDVIYNSIFEGLKSSLDQILDSKTLQLNSPAAYTSGVELVKLPFFKKFILKKDYINNKFQNIPPVGQDLEHQSDVDSKHQLDATVGGINSLNLETFLKNKTKYLFKDIPMINLKKKPDIYIPHQQFSFGNTYFSKTFHQSRWWEMIQNRFLNLNILKLNHSIKGGNLNDLLDFNKTISTPSTYFKTESLQNKILINNDFFHNLSSFETTNKYNIQDASLNINTNQSFIKLPATISKNNFAGLQNLLSDTPNIKKQEKIIYPDRSIIPFGSKFKDKNSFLFLSNYINLITNNIKVILNPYKLRLTYLPEININFQTETNKYNLINKNSKNNFIPNKNLIGRTQDMQSLLKFKNGFPSQAEKIFLSYLSKTKKTYKIKKLKTYCLPSKGDKAPSLLVLPTSLKNLKFKSKLKLKKNINESILFKFSSQQEKKKTIISGNKIKTSAPSGAQLLKTRLFISKEINFLKSNKSINLKRSEKTSNRHSHSRWDKLNLEKSHISDSILVSHLGQASLNLEKNSRIVEDLASGNDASKKFLDILTKKKNLKIKRRLKKMKKETRRRKKRKIFYPRPMWITFCLYQNFLNHRYLPITDKSLNFKDNVKNNSERTAPLLIPNSSMPLNAFRKNKSSPALASSPGKNLVGTGGHATLERIRKEKTLASSGDAYPSTGTIHNKNYKNKQSFQGKELTYTFQAKISAFSEKNALLNNTKDFYRTSSTVFADLKRILMKSNWLRSYLNPYFEKVKNIYKEMQNSSKKMEFYLKIRNFILFFYGSDNQYNNFLFKNNQTPKEILSLEKQAQLNTFPGASERRDISSKRIHKEFAWGAIPSRLKSQNSLNIIEYNRIIYQRIQRIILSIKENLNLNGEIKNRSKKLGKNIRAFIKRDYKSSAALSAQNLNGNQNSSFWTKIIKNNILKLNTYISYGYNELSQAPKNTIFNLSRNNLFWALNKTNISPSGSTENLYSYPKKLWEIYKTREISKSNKTKKIIFNILMKYEFLTNPSKSFDGYNHALQQIYNNNISNITTVNPISSFPEGKEVTNPSWVAQNEFQNKGNPIFLPLKSYIIKSEQKLINIENKLKLLGLYSKKRGVSPALREFNGRARSLNSPYENSPCPTGGQEKNYKNAYFRSLKQQLIAGVHPGQINQKYIKKGKISYLSDSSGNKQTILKINNQKNIPFSSLNNYNKLSNNYSYWWSRSSFKTNPTLVERLAQAPILSYNFKKGEEKSLLSKISLLDFDASSILEKKITGNFLSSETIFSLLFHFCTLVSFISLGGVRTLIKFYYLLISKTSKLISQISFIELFRPSLLLNNRRDSQFYVKNPKLTQGANLSFSNLNPYSFGKETKKVETKTSSILSQKDDFALKLFFLQCIITRNGEFKSANNFSSNLWLNPSAEGKTDPRTSKGWAASKNINNKFLISNIFNNSFQEGEKEFEIRTSYVNAKVFQDIFENFNPLQKSTLAPGGNIKFSSSSVNLNLNKYKISVAYYCFLKLSSIFYLSHKTSFYIYLLLLKSIDLFAAPISFIYKFFEKPGEYVVENLAYNFLVEWSADLITTIPDTVDVSTYSYFSKINRNIYPIILLNTTFGFTFPSLLNKKNFTYFLEKNNYLAPFLFSISNSILKRLLNSALLIFIQQLCEPDLDYINRQKKGIIFWDIWGESLKQVAEENSINIYELTTDKEEQIKLLSKYEEILLKNINSNHLNHSNFSKILRSSGRDPQQQQSILKNKSNTSRLQPIHKLGKTKPLKILWNSLFPSPFYSSYDTTGSLKEKTDVLKKSKGVLTKNNNFGWSVSQFLSYQGKDTDLFIDLHPPKSFWSMPSLKYSYSIQQPIGSIVCQIFSGIFYKQISKNILVVGSAGLEKSLLIQAMAGETELKMITDNANRYAMVYRGVAVGIKLLRDVFEALSVHTPCIFLMEDIHAIGERRPFLIDETSANDDASYNKNQSMQGLLLKEKTEGAREILYRSSKHLLSHYKKPYKEPKSLATNHFSFTFLFANLPGGTKTRNNDFKPGGAALSIQVLKKENELKYKTSSMNKDMVSSQNNQSFSGDPFQIFSDANSSTGHNKKNKYSSSLEIKTDKSQFLAPPASSPFCVLILKEEKKLKHKKLVKEMPWFGLPGEQFSLVSKYNYSIRVKVALLADLVLSNLSVKLDMITDLLVIIDSVKGNRGFVVFATTHIPYILDPALRRPGRFDETICLPLISTLFTRWSNYRYNVKYLSTSLFSKYCIPLNSTFNKGITLDLFKYNLIDYQENIRSSNQSCNELINYLYKKNSTFNQKVINKSKTMRCHAMKNSSLEKTNKYSLSLKNFKERKNIINIINNKKILQGQVSRDHLPEFSLRESRRDGREANSISSQISNKQLLKLKSKNYSFACKSLISLLLFTSPNSSLKWVSMLKDSNIFFEDYSVYLSLFGGSYPLMLKIILMSLIGGKIGESFVLNSLQRNEKVLNNSQTDKPLRVHGKEYAKNLQEIYTTAVPPFGSLNSTGGQGNSFLFNFDNTWKHASSLLFSYLQKRQCSILNKNVTSCSYSKGVNKLLSFNNKYSLMEAPSPPISNILLPSKRYENYKKTFNNQYEMINNQNTFNGSIFEKLQLHQQQRLLRRLYKYPIKEFFKSEILNSQGLLQINSSLSPSSTILEKPNSEKIIDTLPANFSNFNNSYLTLAPLEKTNLTKLTKISSINWCYKNILYNRHRTYLTNQWWNGQQGEHNAETTFLSDIDWRYTFVQSIGDINIDFPDSEQFYNPRNRRWFLTNGDWNYWFNIESELKDVYSHYIYDCFTKAYKYLNQNREIIDFYAEILHQIPLDSPTGLNERELLNLYKRFFYKKL